jgi:hypothetical protein
MIPGMAIEVENLRRLESPLEKTLEKPAPRVTGQGVALILMRCGWSDDRAFLCRRRTAGLAVATVRWIWTVCDRRALCPCARPLC